MGKKGIFPNSRLRLDRCMRGLHINRKYRDRLFCVLFGQDREALLQLYNALHGTAYTNPSQLTIVTLDNVIYMKMVNDLAFVVAGVLNLYEHQSTYNPNMPLRFMLYIAEEYDRITHSQNADIYGEKLVLLPTPQCVVFYNGPGKTGDEELLRLSDALQNKEIPPDLELTVHLRNINLGHNRVLMSQCPRLWEYASLVGRIRENLTGGMSTNAAVEEAVSYCVEQGILTEFLRENRSGVMGMLRALTEFDEKKHIRLMKQYAREDGVAEGLAEGRTLGLTEGQAVGILQGRAAVILEFLSAHGEVPVELQKRVTEQTDISVLRSWTHIAAHCDSIADFIEKTDCNKY